MISPYDEVPDDRYCVFCGQELSQNPEPLSWQFQGFCDAECCLRHNLEQCKFADDHAHLLTRKETMKAIDEITKVWRESRG